MNEQKIADFESELISLCSKHKKDIPHASLVGVLTVVAHIYMDAQLSSVDFVDVKEKESASPLPVETKS